MPVTDFQKSLWLAEKLALSEYRLRVLEKDHRGLSSLIEAEKKLLEEAADAVHHDFTATQYLDQARQVVAARKAREQAIKSSPLGDLQDLLGNLWAKKSDEQFGPDIPVEDRPTIPFDISLERTLAGLSVSVQSEDMLRTLEYLRDLVVKAIGHLCEADIPALIGYRLISPKDNGNIH